MVAVPLLPHAEPGGIPADVRRAETAYLWGRMGWVLRLRWFAVAGVLMMTALAHFSGAVGTGLPLSIVAVLLALSNVGFAWQHRRTSTSTPLHVLQVQLLAQLLVDVGALATLLHWSDGVENPFTMYFAFHMAIAAKLLPPRMAYTVAAVTTLLQGGIVLAEHTGLLAHHSLFVDESGPYDPIIESPPYLFAWFFAFASTMFGTVYFMSAAASRYRDALAVQARLERAAAAQERFARLGELSGGVAHSIRNPLHGLVSGLDLLKLQAGRQPELAPTLALLEEGIDRIERITERLLSYTRQGPLRLESVEAGPWLRAALAAFQRAREGFPVDTSGVHLDQVRLRGDPGLLTEALLNLLDNAADACQAGGSVAVVAERRGREILVEVRDSGEGIDPAALPQVLEPFFTQKEPGRGSGLGLSIARRVVEEHGGRLELASQPGVGTSVRVTLPAEDAP